MSSVYNLEPQPTAKLILSTTAGDITLELFAKQTPLASRNFLQHCLNGYYTNTTFHRLVPSFILQGGDPTNTGTGGIPAINDGEPFEDEFHSRLKFNRRGLLGMANEGKDQNGSQFFFTLGATPELQGKHTMFGRVEAGDTIFNLMAIAEGELVEGTERPLYPVRVTGCEVLVNPFEDMVVQVKEAPRVRDDGGGSGGRREAVRKRKKGAAGGKNVLSFAGGEEDGEEEVVMPVLKKAKANPKVVAIVDEDTENTKGDAIAAKPRHEKPRRRRTPSPSPDEDPQEPQSTSRVAPAERTKAASPSTSPEPEPTQKLSKLEKTNAEIAALKASMKRNVDVVPTIKEKPKNALEAMIPNTSTRGRKRGKVADEKGAFDLFKSFKQKLEDMPTSIAAEPANAIPGEAQANGHTPNLLPTTSAEPTATADDDEEAALCDLHFIANCQSCKSWDDEGNKPDAEAEMDGEDDPAWMSHRLTFAKDTLGKDLEWKRKMEEIEIIDPRAKAREIKEEQKKGKGRDRRKEK